MSTKRRQDGGWDDGSDQRRGPNGRRLCRRCEAEVPPSRRTFCGSGCVREWRIRTDPGFVREEVFKRDGGVCAKCGHRTCEDLAAVLKDRPSRGWRGTGHRWQADHIVPVIEGGGECGLDGYRTLCIPCHKAETAELVARRARKRRDEVQPALLGAAEVAP